MPRVTSVTSRKHYIYRRKPSQGLDMLAVEVKNILRKGYVALRCLAWRRHIRFRSQNKLAD